MPTITLDQNVYKRLKAAAEEHETTADALLEDAARQYLWEMERQKISEESEMFRQQYPELKEKYLGQYVAMHQGKVVDHDVNEDELWKRVRERYGRTPVLIVRVEETPDRTFTRLGFRYE